MHEDNRHVVDMAKVITAQFRADLQAKPWQCGKPAAKFITKRAAHDADCAIIRMVTYDWPK